MLTPLERLALIGACLVSACNVQTTSGGTCRCALGPNGTARLLLPCGTRTDPVVRIAKGPCRQQRYNGATAGSGDPASVVLFSTQPGTCGVELTFEDGSQSSIEIDFKRTWVPCGDDPHGCGPRIAAVPSEVPLGDQCVDAGVATGH